MIDAMDLVGADLILFNGKIVTLDKRDTVAQAVAIKSDRVAFVGRNEEVLSLIGSRALKIDLAGRCAIPGIVDSHMHPTHLATRLLSEVDCRYPKVKSIADLKMEISKKAAYVGPGNWIIVWGYDDTKLEEKRHVTRWELDEAAPDNPVYVRRVDGHVSVVNTLALKKAGVGGETPDPHSGKIDRSSDGEPTGVLRGRAQELVRASIPSYSLEETKKGLELCFQQLLQHGITSIQASTVGSLHLKAFQELRKEEKLPIRVGLMMDGGEENVLSSLIKTGLETGFGDEWIKIIGVEWVYDGSTSGRTAAYYEPYVGEPENRGFLLYQGETLNSMVLEAHKAGLRVGLDGVGDRGIDACLDAIEKALIALPKEDHRHRIEHCCCVTPSIASRLKRLNVIDMSAAGFIYDLGDAYLANLGESRMKNVLPHRTLKSLGIRAPGHSDSPVCSENPMLGIYGMVTRRTMAGRVLDENECVSVIDALRAYTIDGAYASFEEDEKGTIESGKLADITVLHEDITCIQPERIKDVQIDMTIIGGRVVYQRA